MKRIGICPQCKGPRGYHSFCTKCARLFRKARAVWDRRMERLERIAQAKRQREDELRATFRQLQMSGVTLEEVAAWFGKSLSWVQKTRWQLGVPPFDRPPRTDGKSGRGDEWTAEQDATLLKCIQAGKSRHETAAAIGRTVAAICQRRKNLRYPRFKHDQTCLRTSWNDDRLAELRRMRAAGATYLEIAAALGTTRNSVAMAIYTYLRKTEERP